MIQLEEKQERLSCMEVWGSNRSVTRAVDLPGLTAWVYSMPMESEDGGDVHYLSVCGHSFLSRVVLADVSGHGSEVSGPAQLLHALMREHINTWDQTDFVQGLNRSFRGCVARGKYATAAILGIIGETGHTAFTNAGHLPPLWYRAVTDSWQWLDEDACRQDCGIEGLPVGLIQGTTYHQTLIEFDPNDLLILYTDGITEAQDDSGDMLGPDRLLEWARTAPIDTAAAAGHYLVAQLCSFRKRNFTDDETIIVIQRGTQS